MPHGYNGKILHVDLTTREITIKEPDTAFYRKYMGGSAMGLYYLFKNMPAGVDPLSPENVLCLMASVITGVPISGQSRLTATAKSPLTDCIGDSQMGGFAPAELKFAGFDGIVLKGKADSPLYLWIHDGEAELRDASHLWGKITGEAEAIIKEELDDQKVEVIQIGPAGENLVRFAAIMSMSNRAFGRTGMGAVMGSKNLKAIAIRGKNKPTLADKESLMNLTRWGVKAYPDSDVEGLGKYGTAETTASQQKKGGLPAFNFNSGVFDGWEAIDGTTMYDTILVGAHEGKQNMMGRDTCYSCTVRCKRVVEIEEGPHQVDPHYGGPEYETLATFGSYCGIDNLAAVAKANEYCNKYGMDTISCGATISWAMEAFTEGRLTLEDTGGLELNFGNADVMVQLTKMIGEREGFGGVLAEGSVRAAEKVGNGTEEFLVASKKQEVPAHMPQAKPTLGVIYAANPFGADHQSSEHDGSYEDYPERMAQIGLENPQPSLGMNEEKVRYAMRTQWAYSAMDSVNVCQFVYGPAWHLYDMEQLVVAINAVTGWDVTMDELLELGERRVNMLRAFNAREGIDREQDTLPEKMFKKALKGGATKGVKVDRQEWKEMMDHYYRLSEWDLTTGNPDQEKLESLGIGWIMKG
ncbi:MAG TPA: aldehyde ferredoxin oxidoreductase family protein [Anaerolineales bacterium]|nr:aldehyde ferredoxin oxidoreductase family protein [Anaerolineales bacterium]